MKFVTLAIILTFNWHDVASQGELSSDQVASMKTELSEFPPILHVKPGTNWNLKCSGTPSNQVRVSAFST